MIIRKRAWAAALALSAAAVAAGTVPAYATSTGTGCPQGYELKPLSYVLKQATPGFEDAIKAADANKDKQLCYKLLPGAIPLFEPTFEYRDNNVPA